MHDRCDTFETHIVDPLPIGRCHAVVSVSHYDTARNLIAALIGGGAVLMSQRVEAAATPIEQHSVELRFLRFAIQPLQQF